PYAQFPEALEPPRAVRRRSQPSAWPPPSRAAPRQPAGSPRAGRESFGGLPQAAPLPERADVLRAAGFARHLESYGAGGSRAGSRLRGRRRLRDRQGMAHLRPGPQRDRSPDENHGRIAPRAAERRSQVSEADREGGAGARGNA